MQFLTGRDIAIALAAQLGLSTVDLARDEFDDEIVGRLPAPIALELRAIPLAVEGERVHVACADPLMEALETRLIEALEAPVALVVAAEDEIQWALDHVYATNEQIDGALHDFESAPRHDARSSPSRTRPSSSKSTRTLRSSRSST